MDSAVQAASPASPPSASRAGVERGMGDGATSATAPSSAHAAIPAHSRGWSKKPPEKKARTVGPASRTAQPSPVTKRRIAAAAYSCANTPSHT